MKYDVYNYFFIAFLALAVMSLLVSIFGKNKKTLGSAIVSLIAALIVWSMTSF